MLPRFDLLDLQDTERDGHYRLEVRTDLCTPFHFLYGGSGIAASAEAAERTTGRPMQWITTQFLGSPIPGSTVDLRVDVPAGGRATTQTQVFATVDGEPMFTSLGAHNVRPGGDRAQFVEMPSVPGPDECEEMNALFEADLAGSFFGTMERRVARGLLGRTAIDAPQSEPAALWCRIVDQPVGSPATQAYVADIVPMGIGAALGTMPGATSLDNTLRVVDTAPTDWVLLELIPEGYHQSVGQGSLRMWSEDGRLMSTAQQTCIIRTSHHARS